MNRAIRRAVTPVIEGLEGRRLFAVSCNLSSGLLTVTGNDGDDSSWDDEIEILYNSASQQIEVTDHDTLICDELLSSITVGIVVNAQGGWT